MTDCSEPPLPYHYSAATTKSNEEFEPDKRKTQRLETSVVVNGNMQLWENLIDYTNV